MNPKTRAKKINAKADVENKIKEGPEAVKAAKRIKAMKADEASKGYKEVKKAGALKKPKDTPSDNTIKDSQKGRMGKPVERNLKPDGKKNVVYGKDDTPKLKFRGKQ